MTNTYQAVFHLLRESLFDCSQEEDFNCSDWAAIYDEMKKQSVEALASCWLKRNPLPDSQLHAAWMKSCTRQQMNWIRVMVGQNHLLKLLEENHIPCVILKGAAASAAYPHPSLRAAGDVDILVKRCDFYRAAEIMENDGYVSTENPNLSDKQMIQYHWGYNKDNIHFELHRRLPCIEEKDDAFISLFEEGIDHREMRQIESFVFPVLPCYLHGLVLIMHVNQHMTTGLGLRQIVDWVMFAQNNDIESMLPLLKKTGMDKLAHCVTAIGQKYFGLRHIVDDAAQDLCDELIVYIMDNGNFGGKREKEIRRVDYFSSMKSPMKFLKKLQKRGMVRWKAAQKYKCLRPFAWIHGILGLVFYMREKEVTLGDMQKYQQLSAQYSGLHRRLNINRIVTLQKDK